jgi:hypothetical protein
LALDKVAAYVTSSEEEGDSSQFVREEVSGCGGSRIEREDMSED